MVELGGIARAAPGIVMLALSLFTPLPRRLRARSDGDQIARSGARDEGEGGRFAAGQSVNPARHWAG
jgi:hypothetical protein